MSARWNVQLTHGAIEALRALPREEQDAVAARIEHLAASGLPPALRASDADAGAVAVPAGRQVLLCLELREERRVVLVTIRPERETLSEAALRALRAAKPRWLSDWMGGDGMGTTLQDARYATRSLRRSPGFTTTAVLTLALGIGATAAIFSVANGVLLRPLPYQAPEQLVTLWTSWDNFPDKTWVSIPEYQLFHQENRTLTDLALYGTSVTNFTAVENPERVGAAFVTPNTFSVLGVEPAVGRVFTWEEAEDGTNGVLLSYATWQRRHGGDASVVGQTVELNGELSPVIGVLPEGFVLPVDFTSSSPSEVYYSVYVDLESPAPDLGGGGSHGFYGVGRLREGVTLEEARFDLERIMAQVEPIGLYSAERRFTPRLFAAKADIVGTAHGTIMVLLGAVAFVLLIACGNVANLLLSRSEVRMREVAVRSALGAGRTRIFRQLLTESFVLAGVAGVLGFAFAYFGVDALLAIDPEAVPRASEVALDGSVVGFTLFVSFATALLFGVVPAVRVTRRGVGESLHERGRGAQGGAGSNRLQGLLVASQMAMAVILLTGSGLMFKTFVSLLRIDPGFSADNVLTARLSAPSGSYADAVSIAGFYEELLRRVREIPGVERAGAARLLPLASTMGDSYFRPIGYEPGPNESTQGDWQWATPGYFETMGIPLLEGRTFDERDRRGDQPVVIVNDVIRRKYWPNESPLGKTVMAGGGNDTLVVVGVVGNVSHNGITGERKTRFYRPHAQIADGWSGTMRSMTLTIATRGEPSGYIEALRREVRALDPSIPLSEVRTLDDVLSSSVAQPRFAMVLLAAFAAIALTLAVVGVYGVLAYAVTQRTQEIGIRMALGAERGQVVGLVVRQGMWMALAGVGLGTGFAWFMTDLMQGLLYGVTPQDPATFLSVPAVFVAVAALACFIPAARAAAVRPASALRYE